MVDWLTVDSPAERALFVFAPGAGSSRDDPVLTGLSARLSKKGHGVARFDFEYRIRGRKLPDKPEVLRARWREALERATAELAEEVPVIIGGKSMGGRIASLVLAEGGCRATGLMLLGYPLFPINAKPETPPRSEHLPRVAVPTLFVQGTRDALCPLEVLRRGPLPPKKKILVVDEADHSLEVLKRSGRTREEVLDQVAVAVERFFFKRAR
ncbi:MAG: alpha/beta family hydrolase [Polyangiaceae bacterium]